MNDLLQRRKAIADAVLRDSVCDAAVRVLIERALRGFTMDAVALASGISKGTIYNYFRNKDELLTAVHGRAIQPVRAEVEALLASEEPSVLAVLERILRAILRHVERNRATFTLLEAAERECPMLDAQRARDATQFIEDLARLIERGIRQGELRSQDARVTAWLILGLLVYSCTEPMERPEQSPVAARLPEALVPFVLAAVSKPATRNRNGKGTHGTVKTSD